MEENLHHKNVAAGEPLSPEEKRRETDGVEEEEEEHGGGKRKLGGIKAMPFILGNEICDKFAATGFHANMITYLTQVLNLPMGMVSITISATLPSLTPPPCPTQTNCQEASTYQLWFLYMSLLLTSIGTGGIRPCVVTFAADQFDMSRSAVVSRGWNFFNWFYFTIGIATLLALTVVVYIQDNVGWNWGLGIPTIAMGLSIVAFVFGSPIYNKLKPGGSPLVRLAQVVVASLKKRKIAKVEDSGDLYQNKELDALISVNGRLLHTNQFKCLDKAAIVTEQDIPPQSAAAASPAKPNLWRLATVHRVEELKSLIRVFPIWASGILLVAASSHLGSFVILQAFSMNRSFPHSHSSFKIPPASLSIFSVLTMMIGLVLYERLFVPFARRFTKNPVGVTCLQRMGIGAAINIVATIVSALVEKQRKRVAGQYGLLDDPKAVIPISVFWLVPQYLLHGTAEVFSSVGHIEFLYDQSPESMRSTAAALYSLTHSIGHYIGTGLVSTVHKYTGEKENWLPDRNLNRGKLDYYYWLVTGIQVVNFGYYLVVAWLYTYKPLEQENDDGVQFDHHNGKELEEINGDKRNGEFRMV
ncbi:Protein NRT1/ PTR FAMILY 3.1 [Linum perenne]